MPDSTSTNPPKRPATFFCRLEFIEVKGAIGPKAEFDENFFLTNDQSTIDGLLDWRHLTTIGTLEFNHFKKSPLVAYRKLPFVESGYELQELFNSLIALGEFKNIFWFYSDSCVGHETGFLECGGQISSNFFGGIRTCADSTRKTLTMTAQEIRDADVESILDRHYLGRAVKLAESAVKNWNGTKGAPILQNGYKMRRPQRGAATTNDLPRLTDPGRRAGARRLARRHRKSARHSSLDRRAVGRAWPGDSLLWDDVAVGLDGVMLASGGVWLENCADAERVYGDGYGAKILTAAALWKERERRGADFELINNTSNPALVHYHYRRAGSGKSTSRAVLLNDAIANPQAWLESKLGPLAGCEPIARSA